MFQKYGLRRRVWGRDHGSGRVCKKNFRADPGEKILGRVCLKILEQSLVDPDPVFEQGHTRDGKKLIRPCLKFFQESLLKKGEGIPAFVTRGLAGWVTFIGFPLKTVTRARGRLLPGFLSGNLYPAQQRKRRQSRQMMKVTPTDP